MSSLTLHRLHALQSPTIQRVVAIELLAQSASLGLSDDVQRLLQRGIQDASSAGARALSCLNVLVDVRPFETMALHAEDMSWEAAALRFFVLRQAHYPLIRTLFGVTRAEVNNLRRQLNAPLPPVRTPRIPSAQLTEIWRDWQDVQRQFERQADQWIDIAQRYPSHPISALHHALVVEADTQDNHSPRRSA